MSLLANTAPLLDGEKLTVNRVVRLTKSQEKRLVAAAKKSGVRVSAYMRAVLDHSTREGWEIERTVSVSERVVGVKRDSHEQ